MPNQARAVRKSSTKMREYCFIVNNSPEVYRNVSFIHHIIGWYTTSGVGIGKKAALTLLSTSTVFREQWASFQ